MNEISRRRERKKLLGTVGDFIAERLRPDNPIKAAAAHHSAAILAAYYERKNETAKAKV